MKESDKEKDTEEECGSDKVNYSVEINHLQELKYSWRTLSLQFVIVVRVVGVTLGGMFCKFAEKF